MIFVSLLFSLFWPEDFYPAMKWLLAKAAWIYQNGHQLPSQPSYPSLFSSLRRWRYRNQMRSVFSYHRHDILDQRTCLIFQFPVQYVNRVLPKSDLVCILRASRPWKGFALKFFLNSPYLIFSGQQHNLQLSLTLEIARWTLAGFFGVSPFVAIEKDESAWGFVLISCQTRHTFARSFILLSSLWLAGEIETRQVVTPGVKMRWRGRQSTTPRIRAGGFSFSRGFAARARRSCSPLVRSARQNRHATQAKRKDARDAIRWISSDNPAKIFHNYT